MSRPGRSGSTASRCAQKVCWRIWPDTSGGGFTAATALNRIPARVLGVFSNKGSTAARTTYAPFTFASLNAGDAKCRPQRREVSEYEMLDLLVPPRIRAARRQGQMRRGSYPGSGLRRHLLGQRGQRAHRCRVFGKLVDLAAVGHRVAGLGRVGDRRHRRVGAGQHHMLSAGPRGGDGLAASTPTSGLSAVPRTDLETLTASTSMSDSIRGSRISCESFFGDLPSAMGAI